ncbi:MAG: type II toxin-antitoxin system VapC family toxin [Candidatus Aminicenantes bacterium]|nr:type II toxin-antitoxin system VapC family toxin [Candidatus Aminicenantes bacterium]
MMRYMLDTNACIALIKRRPAAAIRRFASLAPGDAGISSITLAELRYGIEKSAAAEKNAAALEAFLLPLEIADFGTAAAEAYGRVRTRLEKAGTPIGPLDTQIGAHALSLGVVLVTNNLREFRRVHGLKVEDWTG